MILLYSVIILLCVILAHTAASCVFWYDKYEESQKEMANCKYEISVLSDKLHRKG